MKQTFLAIFLKYFEELIMFISLKVLIDFIRGLSLSCTYQDKLHDADDKKTRTLEHWTTTDGTPR
jgi:hypothetical protein